MAKFSIRPTLSMHDRAFHGLRGYAGKPFHPPLTDLPVAAYMMAALFDVISVLGGKSRGWAHEFWHAGTYVLVTGFVVSLLAALTGLWDAWKSSEAGTQARRTINTHAALMIVGTVLGLVNVIWRLNSYHTELVTPVGLAILSVVGAAIIAVGATFGGAMVFEYGFNVETGGDHPAWHKSEVDVFHGQH